MEIIKCSQCGGELRRIRTRREWYCPFCNARFMDEPAETAKPKRKYHGLNEEVFTLEGDLSKIMDKKNGAACIRSIARCMDNYGTPAELEDYIMNKCELPDDISAKGVREDQIESIMPLISNVTEPGERIMFYGNKGLFSKGKDFFVITDRRSIFVNKKNVKHLLHRNLDSLLLTDIGTCALNGDWDKCIYNLSGDAPFHGALLALIVLLSFEADNDREKIRILT